MSCKQRMRAPYYILINDEDKSKPKFYHEYPYGVSPYESVYRDKSMYEGYSPIGPRRMRYVETAIKFRYKIAEVLKISADNLKIVRVCNTQKETFKNIKEGKLTEISFENVWE